MTDSEELKVGDTVKVITRQMVHTSQTGKIIKIDPPYWPYRVQFDDGSRSWFEREDLEKVKE
jgi:hypothetical protein